MTDPKYKVAATKPEFMAVDALNYIRNIEALSFFRAAVNRHFQINEDFWSDRADPNSERISIRLIDDLWKFLRTRGLTD